MAIGLKTTEVTEIAALTLSSELIGNINNGTARFPIDAIPEFIHQVVFVRAEDIITLTQEEHFLRHININNADGPVTINLNDSDTYLLNEQDTDGDNISRGGMFCTFTTASPNFPVAFTALSSGNLRGTGNPFQSILENDTIYVGANPGVADEAVVILYKRGGLWIAYCSHGWRSTADGDELVIAGTVIKKGLNTVSDANYEITSADNERPIWLTAGTPGTLTFAADLAIDGMTTSIVNRGGDVATLDFSGHTQIGVTNSIGINEAGTLIVGPIVSGTNREIILKASS